MNNTGSQIDNFGVFDSVAYVHFYSLNILARLVFVRIR